jgi:flagellar basal body-associated protein FliL
MVEQWSWAKFFGGFNIFNPAVRGKLMVQVIMIIIVLSIIGGVTYALFVKRTEHQEQHAQTITNVDTTEKKDGFNLFKLDFKIFGFGN